MSSRRERRKRQFQEPKPHAVVNADFKAKKDAVADRSVRSAEVRTMSPRTLKFVIIALVILVVLWLTAPKPPALPGGQNQIPGATTQEVLKPIDLNTIQTTIPPVNTSTGSALGESLKERMKIN